MCIAAAIGGGALVGAYATDRASKRAADATGDAASSAAATERYMYDTTRDDQAPYRTTGVSALNRLAGMYGLDQHVDPANATTYTSDMPLYELSGGVPVPNASLYQNDPVYRKVWDENLQRQIAAHGRGYARRSDNSTLQYDLRSAMEREPEFRNRTNAASGTTYDNETGRPVNDYSAFTDSPDYQFALQEGNRSVNQGLAARGMSNSGAAMKELTRYGQGMASQQLGNYTNRLASLAGIGQTATQATNMAGMQAARGISSAQLAAGDARASAYQQRGSNINNLINQGTGAFALSQMQPSWGSGMQSGADYSPQYDLGGGQFLTP